MLLENGENVLQEVKLFIARRSPEIVAVNDQRLFLFITRLSVSVQVWRSGGSVFWRYTFCR
jgi:hypothetical protein